MNRGSTRRVSQFLKVIAGAAILLAQTASAESLTGKVLASDGQPIRGASVIALGTASIPWTSFRTSADAAGGFAFNTLTPGSYRLCVEVAAGGYLNPCQWSAAPPTTTISTGESAAGFVITVEKGSTLQLRLNDPNKLSAPKIGNPVPDLLIGAYAANGMFQPAVMRSRDTAGSSYEVTIPFDINTKVSIQSTRLQITQADGTAVVNGIPLQVFHPSGANPNPPALVFQIAGTNP